MITTYAYLQSLLASLRDREDGQTMAEYAIVMVVICVVVMVALVALGGGIKSSLSDTGSHI
jgi:Flp pilus assembly pilin Flp